MKIPDLSSIVAIALAFAVALAAITNLLAVVFRALKMPNAVAIVTRYGFLAHWGAQIVADVAAHPNADGAKLAIADLDKMAEQEPQLAVISARVKGFLRIFGVTFGLLMMALLVGCGDGPPPRLPVCAEWTEVVVDKVAVPVCSRWEDPAPAASASASAAPSTSASASGPEGK